MAASINISRDLVRIMFGVLFFTGLAAASFWILRPFLPALVWAAMIVVATWPLMIRMQGIFWNRRSLAVMVSMLVFVLVFVIPFCMALLTIAANASLMAEWGRSVLNMNLPATPEWMHHIPAVGSLLAEKWQAWRDSDRSSLLAPLAPYVGISFKWFISQIGNAGILLVHFLLTLLLSAILFWQGESAARMALDFARRLGGARGEQAARLAASAVRAVALGVIITALVQSVVAGLGLFIAGVPNVLLLTAIMMLLAVIQVGAVPVLLIVIGWLFWSGAKGWAIFMMVWTVGVGILDNFLRPVLIRRNADLPLLLIFAGIIGGLLSFGVLGLFVGPVVLAVSYTLLLSWMREEKGY